MTDVLQSHSSRSVPVGFYSPPLHPCLMDLPLLLSRPVQHTVAQLSSLLGTRDCRGVAASYQSEGKPRPSFGAPYEPSVVFGCLSPISSLPSFVGVVIVTITVTTSLLASGTACTTCTWAAALLCTAPVTSTSTAASCLASFEACPRRSLLHHPRSSWLLWPRLPVSMPSSSEVSSSL